METNRLDIWKISILLRYARLFKDIDCISRFPDINSRQPQGDAVVVRRH